MTRLFLCEFITGGGMAESPLPEGLAAEGDAMLRALLADLQDLGGLRLATTRDARLAALAPPVTCRTVTALDPVWTLWRRCIRAADAAWPVAPETGGVLARLSRLVLEEGRILIGCRPEAVEVAASKYRTSQILRRCGVPVVDTFRAGMPIPEGCSAWVAKPDQGAGCEDTWYFADRSALEGWMRRAPGREVVMQPYIHGIPASLSLLCYDGRVEVLACNRQHLEIHAGELRSEGVSVNALSDWCEALRPLARSIVSAIPGLRGYVGVDLVLSDRGPVVMEVNPRLTSSYVGLTAALGDNTAARVLRCLGLGTERSDPDAR